MKEVGGVAIDPLVTDTKKAHPFSQCTRPLFFYLFQLKPPSFLFSTPSAPPRVAWWRCHRFTSSSFFPICLQRFCFFAYCSSLLTPVSHDGHWKSIGQLHLVRFDMKFCRIISAVLYVVPQLNLPKIRVSGYSNFCLRWIHYRITWLVYSASRRSSLEAWLKFSFYFGQVVGSFKDIFRPLIDQLISRWSFTTEFLFQKIHFANRVNKF